MTADRIRKKDRVVLGHYMLAYTRPRWNPTTRKYDPDSMRFVSPTIRKVSYGGKLGKAAGTRHCAVCGRKGQEPYCFLDLETMTELFISQHCLSHPAVQLFAEESDVKDIKRWYEQEDLRQGAMAGDPLAAAAMMDEPLSYIYGGDFE